MSFELFYTHDLGDYWFATGTPSFLIHILQRRRLPIDRLEGYEATEEMLTNVDDNFSSPIPLLYQSGYLTIVGISKTDKVKKYKLDFPNEEVRHGFLVSVLKLYSEDPLLNVDSVINKIVEDIRKGDPQDMIERIGSIIMSLSDSPREKYDYFYQDGVGGVFMLLDMRVPLELKMLTESVYCVVEDRHYIYIMEFKVNRSPEKALQQINKKRYSAPFEATGKKIIKIGINFQTEPRDYTYLIE